jgi:ADP-glucose pyrophosphorylase
VPHRSSEPSGCKPLLFSNYRKSGLRRAFVLATNRARAVAEHLDSSGWPDNLMRGAHIGAKTRIRKAIVEEDVHIPVGTIIGFDLVEDRRRFTVSQGGIVVVERHVADRLNRTKEKMKLPQAA